MKPDLGILAPLVVSKQGTSPALERQQLNVSAGRVPWYGPAEYDGIWPRSHQVRLWAGMQKVRAGTKQPEGYPEPDLGLGGMTPNIALFDAFGEIVSDDWYSQAIEQGGFRDLYVGTDNSGTGRKPEYISVSQPEQTHSDSICIAAIQIKLSGGEGAVFYGDVAKACGWPVYASTTKVTFDDGEPYEPWCFWMDSYGWDNEGDPPQKEGEIWQVTNNHKPGSVNFHIPDFMVNNVTLEAYQKDMDLICKAGARLQAHPWMPRKISIYVPPLKYGLVGNTNLLPSTKDQPGVYWNQSTSRSMPGRLRLRDGDADGDDDGYEGDNRGSPARRAPLDFSSDIMTTGKNGDSSFTAEIICGAENAVGPSFVNVQEGKYCDLPNRKILPVCSEAILFDCLQIEENEQGEEEFKVIGLAPAIPRGVGRNFLAKMEKPVVKAYTSVTRMNSSPA